MKRHPMLPPFLAALGVAVLALVAVLLWSWLKPGAKDVPIESVRVSEDGKVLTVTYLTGDEKCYRPQGLGVDGDDDSIELQARLQIVGDGCADPDRPVSQELKLKDPLGTRTITDASTGTTLTPAP